MITGVNSSEANIAKVFLDSYKKEEHKIYFPIAAAFNASETEKVKELISALNAEQRKNLPKYAEEWKKAQKADPKQLIDYADRILQEIEKGLQEVKKTKNNLVNQKQELFQQYARKMAPDLNKVAYKIESTKSTEAPKSMFTSIANKFRC